MGLYRFQVHICWILRYQGIISTKADLLGKLIRNYSKLPARPRLRRMINGNINEWIVGALFERFVSIMPYLHRGTSIL